MKTCEECKRFYDDDCKMEIEVEEILEQIWADFFENEIRETKTMLIGYSWLEFRCKYCAFFK